jgi:hypothetical protein
MPVSETGYDQSYTLLLKNSPQDIIDIVVENRDLFKMVIYTTAGGGNVNGFLYQNQTQLDPPALSNASLARTVRSFDEKVLIAVLEP